jgi:hypothetical protein
VETTETQSLTPESAIDLLVRPEETPETTEEVLESEDTQPVEAVSDDQEEAYEEEDGEAEESVDDSDVEYEDYENEPVEEEPKKAYYRVKVDGEEVEVTLDQLKQGYSGQQYVQKGMQQAAEARKAAETAYQSLMQERENLQQLVVGMQNGQVTLPVEPNRAQFDADPIGYMEAKMDYEDKLQKWNEVQQQLAAQTHAETNARQAMAQQEAKLLVERLPELRDAKKAAQFKQEISEAAESYGYAPEMLNSITSHRDLLVLRDAMLYRKMMANGERVQGQRKPKKVIKPGSRQVTTNNDIVRKKRANLKKSGRIEDALAMMLK